MSNETNDQLIMICGYSGSGKSYSLKNIRNQDKWLYLNCEAGKRLPYKNNFKNVRISDPREVLAYLDAAIAAGDKSDGVIIDSIDFLMNMYEAKYIKTAPDTRKAWGNYQTFFEEIFQDRIIKYGKPVIIIAHVADSYDEKTLDIKTSIPVKGALKNISIEAFCSFLIFSEKMSIKDLENYHNELLHITPKDEATGLKYCFQTQLTKTTLNKKIRGPDDLFTLEETYIDNDVQLVLDKLTEYYK
uniref:AAA domain protein n=1 Tax=Podoviridae sp. ctIKM86 TaxID=2827729 RepID=A0A8S5SMQ5_9CAUD|nr:MAG TPA: AAA domain protein [Podoviridae sp. ctIKM86]